MIIRTETFAVHSGKEKECAQMARKILRYFAAKIPEARKAFFAPLDDRTKLWMVMEAWDSEDLTKKRTEEKLADPEWEQIIGEFFARQITPLERSGIVNDHYESIEI